MNEIQDCVFRIFLAFEHVCEALDIKYYVMGGTMLGAVRHQGFIPWDDDIDVGLMRVDYEKFLKNAQTFLPEYYVVQSYRTEPEYPMGISKIRDSRTTFMESQLNRLKINHGVYIDVFPLDYYPEARCRQRILDLKLGALKYRIRLGKNMNGLHNKIAECAAQVFGKLLCLKYPNVVDAVAARDTMIASIPKSNLIANYYGAWGKKEIVPTKWYGDGTELCFEGVMVRAPKEYKKWLKHVYGNYMQLPPEEKRGNHHHLSIIDLDKPYTYYIDR